jgi:hypothetical protein
LPANSNASDIVRNAKHRRIRRCLARGGRDRAPIDGRRGARLLLARVMRTKPQQLVEPERPREAVGHEAEAAHAIN